MLIHSSSWFYELGMFSLIGTEIITRAIEKMGGGNVAVEKNPEGNFRTLYLTNPQRCNILCRPGVIGSLFNIQASHISVVNVTGCTGGRI